jgi:hypothetical protein
MSPITVYLVDENEEQRRAYALALGELFEGSGIIIKPIAPLQSPSDYAPLLAVGDVAALILDQKMEDGGVTYSGTELSAYLRSIAPKLPIFILSNYTDNRSLFEQGEGDVEDIVSKQVIAEPTTRDAQIFRARFLRRLNVFADMLGERAQRHHDLLVKSLADKLTIEEEKELGLLETERILPYQATEIGDIKALEAAITDLRKRIRPDEPSSQGNS